jgi:hypothetical protein
MVLEYRVVISFLGVRRSFLCLARAARLSLGCGTNHAFALAVPGVLFLNACDFHPHPQIK